MKLGYYAMLIGLNVSLFYMAVKDDNYPALVFAAIASLSGLLGIFLHRE